MKTYLKRQQYIAEKINPDIAISKWKDWKWQVRHCVRDIETFEKLLNVRFDPEEKEALELTLQKFPLSITPYYLSLIEAEDLKNDPIFMQAFPSPRELIVSPDDMHDPLSEDKDSPVPGITHRYPDRVLFHVSNVCAMYCRHCTRKRKVGDTDHIPDRAHVQQGLDYIAANPYVRDVLLSGGDPFMLPDDHLDWILTELRSIPHVEVIRIGTRTPVVLPYRITDELVSMLSKHHPVWVNTHFNHPREITSSSREALRKLADAGIPLGNQTVLLSGVNDCYRILKRLFHKLVANRVRPYYLYQCDLSEGLTHFRTSVGKGIEIMENLVGHTSGFAVPTYVIDAPEGGGKIPILPSYMISRSTHKVILRNYEGVITSYKEPEDYRPVYCDRDCTECKLQLKLDDAPEYRSVGIAELLSDSEETLSLVPGNTIRLERRNIV
ncbi:MAG: lysine 2,3-aminomutase [Methanolobus sp.]|jgi:lysine 2,3-aminomutase|nr:lysine 2,3-aminomutase [Methanolobus sp.]MDK2833628.1 lysine 2,3-aminomutase [Methanolobus sp.]MDN5308967.1 lysine 2,3-aminomutase [Methanolobus sp.]